MQYPIGGQRTSHPVRGPVGWAGWDAALAASIPSKANNEMSLSSFCATQLQTAFEQKLCLLPWVHFNLFTRDYRSWCLACVTICQNVIPEDKEAGFLLPWKPPETKPTLKRSPIKHHLFSLCSLSNSLKFVPDLVRDKLRNQGFSISDKAASDSRSPTNWERQKGSRLVQCPPHGQAIVAEALPKVNLFSDDERHVLLARGHRQASWLWRDKMPKACSNLCLRKCIYEQSLVV